MSSFDQTTHDLGVLPEGSTLRSVTAVPVTIVGRVALRVGTDPTASPSMGGPESTTSTSRRLWSFLRRSPTAPPLPAIIG
jgi:hypothetical protein